MSEPSPSDQPVIVIEQGNTAARVIIPAAADPRLVSTQLLQSLARERGVEVSAAGEAALRGLVDRFRSARAPVNEVFATAAPAAHGRDGRIEWGPGFDPSHAGGGAGAPDPASGKIDHYARSSFIRVRRDDHIATIYPPTEGSDGRDVCGRSIAARPGKPVTLVIDPSLVGLGDGRVVALIDGQLSFDGRKLAVNPVLEVPGTVDFSTGNIDFEGDVLIRHDVRDRFTVRAVRCVTVEGLVDASHIVCGGDLDARRGIAGRNEGTIEVGGDAHVGYLDEVSGHIAGSLTCSKEIMRSTLFVGGDLVSDLGSIIGGCITVGGNVRVAELGSPSDTPTELRLSRGPDKDSPAGKAAAEIRALCVQIARMEKELAALKSSQRTPVVAERMTELTFEISDLGGQVLTLAGSDPALADGMAFGVCASTLDVMRVIHGRVTVRLGHHVVVFADAVKGPVRIWLEDAHTVMYRFGDGAPKPIRVLPGVIDRVAA